MYIRGSSLHAIEPRYDLGDLFGVELGEAFECEVIGCCVLMTLSTTDTRSDVAQHAIIPGLPILREADTAGVFQALSMEWVNAWFNQNTWEDVALIGVHGRPQWNPCCAVRLCGVDVVEYNSTPRAMEAETGNFGEYAGFRWRDRILGFSYVERSGREREARRLREEEARLLIEREAEEREAPENCISL